MEYPDTHLRPAYRVLVSMASTGGWYEASSEERDDATDQLGGSCERPRRRGAPAWSFDDDLFLTGQPAPLPYSIFVLYDVDDLAVMVQLVHRLRSSTLAACFGSRCASADRFSSSITVRRRAARAGRRGRGRPPWVRAAGRRPGPRSGCGRVEDVAAVRHREGTARVLLHHQDRDAAGVDLRDLLEDQVDAIGDSPADGSSSSRSCRAWPSARARARASAARRRTASPRAGAAAPRAGKEIEHLGDR